MIKQYIPDMSDAWHIGAATNQGMGIRSGISLGGQTKLMGGFQGRDTIREDGTRVTPGVISEGGLPAFAAQISTEEGRASTALYMLMSSVEDARDLPALSADLQPLKPLDPAPNPRSHIKLVPN